MFGAFSIHYCRSGVLKKNDSEQVPGPTDGVLRQDAERPSHALYLKPGALWSVATGLWFVWSLAIWNKENRTHREAHSHPHISGSMDLGLFGEEMCGLRLTYFESQIKMFIFGNSGTVKNYTVVVI